MLNIKEDKWKKRIATCHHIKNNSLPQLEDILRRLKGEEYLDTSLSDNILKVEELIKTFEVALNDKEMADGELVALKDRILPKIRDVLITLNLLRYGD